MDVATIAPTGTRQRAAYVLRELRYLPNQFTAVRLVLVVVLWGFALAGNAVVVGVGLGLAFVTDVADGYFARRLNRTSSFGSKFDSLVDSLVAPSAIAWLLMLKPEVVLDHKLLAALWVAATYSSLMLGLVRHRRFANLHLQSSRIACVAQYAFLVDVFVAPSYSPLLLYLAAGLGIYSSLETLVLQLAFDELTEGERSFARALRRRRVAA
jgi:phosphatidylglycerophosphate synthase